MSLLILLFFILLLVCWFVDMKIQRYRIKERKSQTLRFDTYEYLELLNEGEYQMQYRDEEIGIDINKKTIYINKKQGSSKQLKTLYETWYQYKKYQELQMFKQQSPIFSAILAFIGELLKVALPSLIIVNIILQFDLFTILILIAYIGLILNYYVTDWKMNKRVSEEIKQILNVNNDLNAEKMNYIQLLKLKSSAKMFVYFVLRKRAL